MPRRVTELGKSPNTIEVENTPESRMQKHPYGSGFEVKFQESWYSKSPVCRHGPMLLFEKFTGSKKDGQRFYACSACRSRKDCTAFIYEDEYKRKFRQDVRIFLGEEKDSATTASTLNWSDNLSAKASKRFFCFDCHLLFLADYAKNSSHRCFKHNKKKGITNNELFHPSRHLLKPLHNDKKNAQYFLSAKSLRFILETLKSLKFTHILCVGMPTLHEEIQYERHISNNNHDTVNQMDSMLLDIDDRFMQFNSEDKFCHFNMFNHHFFDNNYLEKMKIFLNDDSKVCIVLDPPFGGLVDAIAETLKWLSQIVNNILTVGNRKNLLPVLWVFPYFMEKRIINVLPTLQMLDYQVNYENHAKFKKTHTSSRISPVRIFTNINLSRFSLPKNEGYRFCQKCDRYVAQENNHCLICDTCPSKTGKTYVHCEKCGCCVKPSRVHCNVCETCELPDHKCSVLGTVSQGCHICGKLTHKRRDCPLQATKRRIVDTNEEAWKSNYDHTIFHYGSSHLKKKRKYNFYL